MSQSAGRKKKGTADDMKRTNSRRKSASSRTHAEATLVPKKEEDEKSDLERNYDILSKPKT